MHTRIMFAVFCVLACLAVSAQGKDVRPKPQQIHRQQDFIRSAGPLGAKAVTDTILLMGPSASGAAYFGDFESGWNGWTSEDVTQSRDFNWQVSDYNQAVAGNLAAWCGSLDFPACDDSVDIDGGYGNNWDDLLTLRLVVADPGLRATVRVTATLQTDCEPTYDLTHLTAHLGLATSLTNVASWDGKGTYSVDEFFFVDPAEFVDGNTVMVSFRFSSDGAWSDEDCSYASTGGAQVDDITVTVSQSGQTDLASTTDFQDGTLGAWAATAGNGVGDFAKLWQGLRDIDPCRTNTSQQVAFIDDGLVVPGTGGTSCITWCYGPGGYIVNNTGGLAGSGARLHNVVISPPMVWPDATMAGAVFAYDAYVHTEFGLSTSGMFEVWNVRSADTDGSAGNGVQVLEDQPWGAHNFLYDRPPQYVRAEWAVGDLMEPGRDLVQVQVGVYELGWVWGWDGPDGTPAPYFDNISFKVHDVRGPALRAFRGHLAQDGFPEIDHIDFADLGAMHVRFDMAANIAPPADLRNDPGDSLVLEVWPQREGATTFGQPELHYVIESNPVFDSFRTTAVSGVVPGQAIDGVRWSFDLPDTGTLYPGDVLHYYYRAGDDLGGVVQYNTMPVDLTGFGDFASPLAYDTQFVVHALPSIRLDGPGEYVTPEILFWNDNANRGGEEEWYTALHTLGRVPGQNYDIYNTRSPGSGLGNGVGGRTDGSSLAPYDVLLYTAGDLTSFTLSTGDYGEDPGDDVGAIRNWLDTGDKKLFLTGDQVVTDLVLSSNSAGQAFVADVLGLDHVGGILRPLIDGQASPVVANETGNPVLVNFLNWMAYGGCPGLSAFDAVTPRSGAQRLAQFTDISGATGAYSYSAATLNTYGTNCRIISLPFDFQYIRTISQEKGAPLAARTVLLNEVLEYFGTTGGGTVTGVPELTVFAVTAAPNPFNPVTRLEYSIKTAGYLSLKIYNVRGQLVRTLIERQVQTGGHVLWQGTNDAGASVASGVYFVEAEMAGEVQVSKLALIK